MNNRDCPKQNILPRRAASAFRHAFTLIELLIVISLTAVLFALLLIPLVSALRYTQQAQIVTAAQDAARITQERITRELGSAVFVFDGTSHPFQLANGAKLKLGDDAYSNFLDLQILNSAGAPVIAQAFNAKLDFVLPKLSDNSGKALTDPTTGEPIAYAQSPSGSAIISNPSYVFPLAAGTTMIRYFVGLKNPTQPYNNTREGVTDTTSTDRGTNNTYVLYRAQFLPYEDVTDSTGKVTGVTPNKDLFALRLRADGTPLTPNIPDLDDPDFFRYVTTSDVNWLNDSHVAYTAQEVKDHNARVDKWAQIAKVVIPGPNVDLLLLPHNADNTLAYDVATGAFPGPFPGVAHSGVATDPVTGKPYPIVNTSCTFRPATVSGNATPGTTANYNSQGVVSVDQSGFTYIPTLYTATSQSWSLPYHVSVFPGTYGSTSGDAATNDALNMYYDTEQFAAGRIAVTAPSNYPTSGYNGPPGPLSINPGDILEYSHVPSDAANPQGKLAYDVTQGFPVNYDGTNYNLGGTAFVPMTINPDTGTIAFTAPSLPNGPYDRLNRQWIYNALPTGAAANTPGIASDGTVDLTLPASDPPKLTDSPLQGVHSLTSTGGPMLTGVRNAHIVPGSVRVMGPDQAPGPGFGQPTTYTEIKPSLSDVGDNQYSIDYGTSVLHLRSGTAGVSVIYDYQANDSLTTPLPAILPSGFTLADLPNATSPSYLPFLPMQVQVDYQTRDLIDVSIGVRIYDVTNNRAQVIPVETKIKIGNSNR